MHAESQAAQAPTESCLQPLQLKAATKKQKKKAKTARAKARLARPQTRSQDAGWAALPIRQGGSNNLCGCSSYMHNIFTCCTLAACCMTLCKQFAQDHNLNHIGLDCRVNVATQSADLILPQCKHSYNNDQSYVASRSGSSLLIDA